MFILLGIIVLALGFIPLIRAFRARKRLEERQYRNRLIRAAGVLTGVILFMIAFNVFAGLFTEFLWFRQLDYSGRFLTALRFEVVLYFVGFLFALLFIYFNVRFAFGKIGTKLRRFASFPLSLVLALLLAVSTSNMWEEFLLFFNQVQSPMADPLFGKPINFYLFSLPLYSSLIVWLMLVFVLTLGIVGLSLLRLVRGEGRVGITEESEETMRSAVRVLSRQLMILTALPLFVLTWNSVLNIYRLMFSEWGVVYGAGYVDANVRLIGHAITAGALGITGVLFLIGAARASFRRKLFGFRAQEGKGVQVTGKIFVLPAVLIGTIVLVTAIVPGIVNALVVKPNEITLEEPYLAHNIEFTRNAYGLSEDRIEERQYPVGTDISSTVIDGNTQTLENIRLWDPRALQANLQQRQEIRLYYEFFDVDVDRYTIDGDYRQMMLSVRELEKDDLNIESQTWVSRHLLYTHGYGLVMLPAHDFLSEGRPDLLIRGIPPETTVEALEVTRPEIYYGERTRDHVYVMTTREEFDYPAGEANMYTTYEGTGGVRIDSFFKRFLFSWKNDGFRLFLTSYITRDSRVMFHRQLSDRFSTLAPFLSLDRDPYAVLTEDGRIKYIFDAYTTSANYPYSEVYAGFLDHFTGVNYLRNSVKAVIDAYDGSVDLYIVDPDDIIVQTYNRIFPELFKPMDEMPENLQRHIRYPEDYLTVQAEMYATYHMTDVDVFYQREDVWEFATERYRANFQWIEPYYMMLKFPDEERTEFVLVLPFTPQNKNVINAWIAGRCDIPEYGKLVVYRLPKQQFSK